MRRSFGSSRAMPPSRPFPLQWNVHVGYTFRSVRSTKYAIMHVAMRICPKCRLIASDDPVCPECGWNIAAGEATGPASDLALRYATNLQSMALFIALMFGASLLGSLAT